MKNFFFWDENKDKIRTNDDDNQNDLVKHIESINRERETREKKRNLRQQLLKLPTSISNENMLLFFSSNKHM